METGCTTGTNGKSNSNSTASINNRNSNINNDTTSIDNSSGSNTNNDNNKQQGPTEVVQLELGLHRHHRRPDRLHGHGGAQDCETNY